MFKQTLSEIATRLNSTPSFEGKEFFQEAIQRLDAASDIVDLGRTTRALLHHVSATQASFEAADAELFQSPEYRALYLEKKIKETKRDVFNLRLEELEEKCAAKESEFEGLLNEVTSLEATLSQLEVEKQILIHERDALHKEVKDLRNDLTRTKFSQAEAAVVVEDAPTSTRPKLKLRFVASEKAESSDKRYQTAPLSVSLKELIDHKKELHSDSHPQEASAG